MSGNALRPSEARRLVGVDVLRAISIAVVLGNHWFYAALVNSVAVEHWLAVAFLPGANGVTLFFVVSGFLICHTTLRRERDFFQLSLAAFYVRRLARTQPLLWVTIAIGLIALAFGNPSDKWFRFVFSNEDASSVVYWLSLLSFTYNWFRIVADSQNSMVGLQWSLLWSLAVEEQFYLLFPLAVLLVRQRGRLIGLLVFLMILGPAARLVADVHSWGRFTITTNSFACFDALAFGVLTALVADRVSPAIGVRKMLVAAGFALMLPAYFWANFVLAPTVLAFGAALFILGAIGQGLFVSRLWLPIARVGELSFGLYLLHPALFLLVAPWLRQMSFSGGFAAFFVVAVGVAALSYRYFEEPANRLIRARLKRPRAIALQLG